MLKLRLHKRSEYDKRTNITCPNCEAQIAFIVMVPTICDYCEQEFPPIVNMIKNRSERVRYHFLK